MRLKVFLFVLALLLPVSAQAGLLNQPAPEFSLQDTYGRSVSLKDFKGKVVFIDFWASWCSPCKEEFPELNRMLDKYKNSDVAVVAVNVDKKRSHVDDFVGRFPTISNKLHILLDPQAKVIKTYNASAMPTSFILDKNGIVRYVHFGYRDTDPENWSEEIDKLLKQ